MHSLRDISGLENDPHSGSAFLGPMNLDNQYSILMRKVNVKVGEVAMKFFKTNYVTKIKILELMEHWK